MDEQFHQMIKRFMPLKIAFLTILAVLFSALAVSQIWDIKEKISPPGTAVFSGTGKVIGIPDIATLNFSVIASGQTTRGVIAENSRKMNDIIKFVKDSGVDEKDIKTAAYYLNPRYDWVEGTRIFRGYELNSTLQVKIRDLEKIGEIIDGTVAKGANQVGDIQFSVDDPERLKEEARAKAIKNAKEKAEKTASALGWKLKRIISFSESGDSGVYPAYYGIGGGGALKEEAAPAPDIEQGSQEITVNVSLTFELK